MNSFDISKNWRILAPASVPAVLHTAAELAAYIHLLRKQAGLVTSTDRNGMKGGSPLDGGPPPVDDAETVSCPDSVPIILLTAAVESRDRNGFGWRIGKDRIEISGDSIRGLWNGVFDFLAALGFRWPEPGIEELPPFGTANLDETVPAVYPLKTDRSHCPSAVSVRERRRFTIDKKTNAKKQELLVSWAARNKYDALVFPFRENKFWSKMRRGRGIHGIIERYSLILEAGGSELSFLLPRNLFFFHRDLFRMESGKRVKQYHFCSTNPQTILCIEKQAEKLFCLVMPGMAVKDADKNVDMIFHLWPDRGHETSWCACPPCRAFSPAEQNHIAVNIAADVLAKLNPRALLSCFELSEESGSIALRDNVFVMSH